MQMTDFSFVWFGFLRTTMQVNKYREHVMSFHMLMALHVIVITSIPKRIVVLATVCEMENKSIRNWDVAFMQMTQFNIIVYTSSTSYRR